jgi:hypothetical protein
MTKGLYLLTRKKQEWDSYSGVVVCAYNMAQAKKIHPGGGGENKNWENDTHLLSIWERPKDLRCLYIGQASKKLEVGVVLASYIGS